MTTLPPRKLEVHGQPHLFLWILISAVVAAVAWSMVGRLDVVSLAVGEVVPSSQVKVIQHLEGGIVAAIHVREGDRVRAGQTLVALETTASGANVDELSVRLSSLQADVVRLSADVMGKEELNFPVGFVATNPALARQVEAMFISRRQQLDNDMNVQRALINQRSREFDEIAARQQNSHEKLKLLKEQVSISEDLLKEKLTNRMLHLNILKELSNTNGMISEDRAGLKRLEAAIQQERLKLITIESRFRIEAREDLDEKRQSLDELQNRQLKFQDSFKRSVLVSPVDGIVMTLHVSTVGGVIQPGGKVVDVVPVDDALVVEAKLPPQDVGFIHVGQAARVTLASGDGARFDHLNGEVVHISPDTVDMEDGSSYYKVRLKIERDYFESKGESYRLVPGVQVMCSIITGSRTVMQYILSPFIGSFSSALQER